MKLNDYELDEKSAFYKSLKEAVETLLAVTSETKGKDMKLTHEDKEYKIVIEVTTK